MIVKEKTQDIVNAAQEKLLRQKKERTGLSTSAAAVMSAVCGGIFSGAYGGTGIPVCAALCAAAPPMYGMCVFMGAAVSYLATGTADEFAADIIAMPMMIFAGFLAELLHKKRPSAAAAAVMAAVLYITGGAAAAFFREITLPLILAVLFRGLLCGGVAYYSSACMETVSTDGRINVTGEKAVGTAALYVLGMAALCCVRAGNFCLGRIIAMFVILAAGGRFGAGGSAVTGALSALGIILGETGGSDLSDMVRSSAIISCSGMAACLASRRGRTASAVVFAASAAGLIIFMGRLQWAAALLSDTVAAAALYCLIPDKIYMKCINGVLNTGAASAEHFRDSTAFAAETVKALREKVSRAAELLGGEAHMDAAAVSRTVCGRVCLSCRSSEICCRGEAHRRKYVFPAVVNRMSGRGFITERELPRGLEDCPRKSELADIFNSEYYGGKVEQRLAEAASGMWDAAAEQLSAQEEILRCIGGGENLCDEGLSRRVGEMISLCGGKKSSAAVFFDSGGHIYISCFYRSSLDISMEELTEKLSEVTDRQLDKPQCFAKGGIMRIRWHEPAVFAADTGKSVKNGREDVSGDSSAYFEDGFGSVYYIISDGMGSGQRAALESGMTVSILTNLIKAGMGVGAAVKNANLLLSAKSGEEIFATADIMRINLFTGRTDLYKLGAAQTLFRTGGAVKAVESRTLPLGIIIPAEPEQRTLHLSDGDAAVMFSDGIREESFPRVRELMLSDGYSPQRCADGIIEYCGENEKCPPDDKTVFVVRLHKI